MRGKLSGLGTRAYQESDESLSITKRKPGGKSVPVTIYDEVFSESFDMAKIKMNARLQEQTRLPPFGIVHFGILLMAESMEGRRQDINDILRCILNQWFCFQTSRLFNR